MPATLKNLVDFSNASGIVPYIGLLIDANGDLFGTTGGGGAFGFGTVFELMNSAAGYAAAPTILLDFTSAEVGGNGPHSSPFLDSAGNLFGMTLRGGSAGFGTVFELPVTAGVYASTPTTLVNFNAANGASPASNLVADSNGNLFGTTQFGGTKFQAGTVFELPKTATGFASAPTTLFEFNILDGIQPNDGLLIDGGGNLIGTTQQFGLGVPGKGLIYEVVKTPTGYASAPTILVQFTGPNGATPLGNLISDSQGDLFGVTFQGGANDQGTVFELAKTATGYASTVTTLVAFNGADGGAPSGGLIIDAAGNLFGTTQSGGVNGVGTAFEIQKTATGYASAPLTLANFDLPTGSVPISNLVADKNGNLFGMANAGGAHGGGVLFEITGSGFVVQAPLNAPVVSGISPDTGSSATDGITNAAIVAVNGTSTPGATVQVYDNANPIGVAVADAGGVWVLSNVSLIDGGNALTAAVKDSSGNLGPLSAAFLAVLDTTAPVLSPLANQTIEAGFGETAAVTFPAVTAIDNLDPNPTIVAPIPGVYGLGSSIVTARATDAAGNTATETATVTVVDTTPPVLSSLANQTIEATFGEQAFVSFPQVTVTDSADPNPVLLQSPQSGFFALGTTTVTASARDIAGNFVSETATVTVVDTTPPVLSPLANQTIEATFGEQAFVSFPQGTVTDSADPNPVLIQSPQSGFFALGTTTVTASARDAAGNFVSETATVTVVDTKPPVLSPQADINIAATSAAGAAVALNVLATDSADPNPSVTYREGVNPIVPGQTLSIGAHLITATATDLAGNTASESFTVTVSGTRLPPVVVQPVLPVTVAEGHALTNLSALILANARDAGTVNITSVTGTGLEGTLSFDSLHQSLTYQATGLDPAHPVDTFSYTLTDDLGLTVSGQVAVTVTGPALPTTYATQPGATVTASGAGQRLISGAPGQTLAGSGAGGDEFFGGGDTRIRAAGDGNTIFVMTGNHTIAMGRNGNTVTAADGNNTITGTGNGNVVTVGNGNNAVRISGAGNSVTAGNGANFLFGGAGGNALIKAGNGANIIIAGGSHDVFVTGNGANTILAQGANASITAGDGGNTIVAGGAGDVIATGSGNDVISVLVGAARISAGLGTNRITFAGRGNVVVNQGGLDTLVDQGGRNTIVLPAAGGGEDFIRGNVLGNGDVFDLRPALAATTWDHLAADISKYVSVRSQGGNTLVSLNPTGAPGGVTSTLAVLNNTGPVSLSNFLAHAITA